MGVNDFYGVPTRGRRSSLVDHFLSFYGPPVRAPQDTAIERGGLAGAQQQQNQLERQAIETGDSSVLAAVERAREKPDGGIMGKLLSILDIPRAIAGSAVAEGADALVDLGQSAHIVAPDTADENVDASWDDFVTQIRDHRGFGDQLEEKNVDAGLDGWGNRALGFAGDVAMDPLSYVSFGTTNAVGKADDAVRLVDAASEAGRIGRGTTFVVDAAGEATKVPGAVRAIDDTGRVSRKLLQKEVIARRIESDTPRLLDMGFTREQIDKAIDDVLRDGGGMLGGTGIGEAMSQPLRTGMTFGVGDMRVMVPGTEGMARRVAETAAAIKNGTFRKIPIPDGLRMNPMLAKLKNKPGGAVKAFRIKESMNEAHEVTNVAMHTLVQQWRALKAEFENAVDPEALARAVDSGKGLADTPGAAEMKAFYENAARAYHAITGRTIKTRENYLPHQLADEFVEFLKATGGKTHMGGKPSEFAASLERKLRPGMTWMGYKIEDGTIEELNRIAAEVWGPDYVKLLSTDPWALGEGYLQGLGRAMQQHAYERFLKERGLVEFYDPAAFVRKGRRGKTLKSPSFLSASIDSRADKVERKLIPMWEKVRDDARAKIAAGPEAAGPSELDRRAAAQIRRQADRAEAEAAAAADDIATLEDELALAEAEQAIAARNASAAPDSTALDRATKAVEDAKARLEAAKATHQAKLDALQGLEDERYAQALHNFNEKEAVRAEMEAQRAAEEAVDAEPPPTVKLTQVVETVEEPAPTPKPAKPKPAPKAAKPKTPGKRHLAKKANLALEYERVGGEMAAIDDELVRLDAQLEEFPERIDEAVAQVRAAQQAPAPVATSDEVARLERVIEEQKADGSPRSVIQLLEKKLEEARKAAPAVADDTAEQVDTLIENLDILHQRLRDMETHARRLRWDREVLVKEHAKLNLQAKELDDIERSMAAPKVKLEEVTPEQADVAARDAEIPNPEQFSTWTSADRTRRYDYIDGAWRQRGKDHVMDDEALDAAEQAAQTVTRKRKVPGRYTWTADSGMTYEVERASEFWVAKVDGRTILDAKTKKGIEQAIAEHQVSLRPKAAAGFVMDGRRTVGWRDAHGRQWALGRNTTTKGNSHFTETRSAWGIYAPDANGAPAATVKNLKEAEAWLAENADSYGRRRAAGRPPKPPVKKTVESKRTANQIATAERKLKEAVDTLEAEKLNFESAATAQKSMVDLRAENALELEQIKADIEALDGVQQQRAEWAADWRAQADELMTAAAADPDEWSATVAKLEATALMADAKLLSVKGLGDPRATRNGYYYELSDVIPWKREHLDKVVDITARGLKQFSDGNWAEPDVAEAIVALGRIDTPEKVGKIIKGYDALLSRWKAYSLLSPGFHIRNFFGGYFNNSLYGVAPSSYVKWERAVLQMRKAAKAGADHAGQIEAIADREVRAIMRTFEEQEVLGQGIRDIGDITNMHPDSRGVLTATIKGKSIVSDTKAARRIDPTSLDFLPLDWNHRVAGRVEKGLRGPMYLDVMLDGGSVQDAVDTVAKFHFDYGELAAWEKKYMKRVFPFYTWTRKNLPLQLEMIMRRPGRYSAYLHAKDNIELGVEEEGIVPAYYADLLSIHTPFKTRGGKGDDIYLTPDLPFRDLAETLDPKRIVSQVTPILKTPLEVDRGSPYFTDIPFDDRLKPAPSQWAPFMPLLDLLPDALGLPQPVRHSDGTWLLYDKDAYKIEQALPLLGRLRRVYPTEEKFKSRTLTSYLSIFGGIGSRTNDPSQQYGEVRRQNDIIQSALERYRQTNEPLTP